MILIPLIKESILYSFFKITKKNILKWKKLTNLDNQHHHVLFEIYLAFYDASNKSTASQEFPIYQPMKSNFPDLILAIDQMNDRSSLIVPIYFILLSKWKRKLTK